MRPIYRVDLELAYCAWVRLAPAWVARYPRPPLSPWVTVFLEALTSAEASRPGDTPGQSIRRAIIAGATADQPFPGEIRGKAIAVEALVRTLPVDRLAELGTPGSIVRALAPALPIAPASRSA